MFDISDRFEKLYLSEVFLLLRIEAETERPILDWEWLAGERKTFSRLVIEGGDEIGVGGMSWESWIATQGEAFKRGHHEQGTSHAVKEAYRVGFKDGKEAGGGGGVPAQVPHVSAQEQQGVKGVLGANEYLQVPRDQYAQVAFQQLSRVLCKET